MYPTLLLALCATTMNANVSDPPTWYGTADALMSEATDPPRRTWYRVPPVPADRDARDVDFSPPSVEPQTMHKPPIESVLTTPPRQQARASTPTPSCVDSPFVDVWCFEAMPR